MVPVSTGEAGLNTTAHVLMSGVAFGRRKSQWFPATLGALLPDLPMFAFYAYQRLVAGRPEAEIWGSLYFAVEWQAFFDVFNSLPLIVLGAGLAWAMKHEASLVFWGSMGLHAIADLAVHREDGHRHFFPFSDWRFLSPVSYWDPQHHGLVFLTAEALFVVGATVWLARQGGGWRWVALVFGGAHFLFGLFAAVAWGGLLGS